MTPGDVGANRRGLRTETRQGKGLPSIVQHRLSFSFRLSRGYYSSHKSDFRFIIEIISLVADKLKSG